MQPRLEFVASTPAKFLPIYVDAMTCFPPLCRPISRYLRGLFMRAKRHHHAPECPPSTSKAESSMTVLTTGVLVNEKEDQSATDTAM